MKHKGCRGQVVEHGEDHYICKKCGQFIHATIVEKMEMRGSKMQNINLGNYTNKELVALLKEICEELKIRGGIIAVKLRWKNK